MYRLTQEQISRLLLPLEEYPDKEKTRQLAVSAGLDNAFDSDSQEILSLTMKIHILSSLRERVLLLKQGILLIQVEMFWADIMESASYNRPKKRPWNHSWKACFCNSN